MNCCILITNEEVLNQCYRLNNLGIWHINKINSENLSKIDTAYVYFSKVHGITRKLKINLSNKKIAYLVKEKLYNPITLMEFRKFNIIDDDDDMRGAIRYLDTDKTEILKSLWDKKHNAE